MSNQPENKSSSAPVVPGRDSVDGKLNDFGDKVRNFRISRGLTQADLAKTANLDRKTISRIENSQYSPSLASVFAIAEALSIDAKDLV